MKEADLKYNLEMSSDELAFCMALIQMGIHAKDGDKPDVRTILILSIYVHAADGLVNKLGVLMKQNMKDLNAILADNGIPA